jgi:hypothetical protein
MPWAIWTTARGSTPGLQHVAWMVMPSASDRKVVDVSSMPAIVARRGREPEDIEKARLDAGHTHLGPRQ